MGVNKHVSHPSDWPKENPVLQHGPVWSEALLSYGLCHIRSLAGCLGGHRRVPCPDGWTSENHTGVLDGGQEHGMRSCFPVPHRLIPVCCGHHRRTSRNLHKWHSILVHRMCLHSGPPHSSLCLHSGVVQTASLQCLPGMQPPFYFEIAAVSYPWPNLLLYFTVSRAALQQTSAHLWNFDFHFPDGG